MKTITSPKWQRHDKGEEFRALMVSIGARWNNSYLYWMIPAGKEAEADAIRAKYPDNEPPKVINGSTLQFG